MFLKAFFKLTLLLFVCFWCGGRRGFVIRREVFATCVHHVFANSDNSWNQRCSALTLDHHVRPSKCFQKINMGSSLDLLLGNPGETI